MTKNIRTKTISILLTIILICLSLLIAFPEIALASSVEESDEYTGKQVTVSDLHGATKRTYSTDEDPTITVFTHGMSSNFQHWGVYANIIDNQSKVVYKFDYKSLPMQLKTLYDANVYVASSCNEYGSNDETGNNLYCTIDEKQYYTHHETHTGFAVQPIDNDGKVGDYITGGNRIDFSKHTVIIFNENHDENIEIDLRYKQLHDIIDKVIYEYKDIYNFIPRINLIGHSRGGLLNMMYANEHPYNVDSMYGFGSPYNGSLPSLILEKLKSILGDKGNALYENFIKSPVDVYDINNKTAEIKNAWNTGGVTANVNFKTLTSSFDFDFLLALLLTDEMADYVGKVTLDVFRNILDQIIAVLQNVEDTEDDLATATLIVSALSLFLAGPVGAILVGALGVMQKISAEKTQELISSLQDVRNNAENVGDCYQGMVRALYNVRDDGPALINALCQMVFGDNFVSNETLGDIMVQLNSQRAEGYAGTINLCHESYTAAIYECEDGLSYVGKGLDGDYFPLVSAVGQPAIPHNLECRNPHFVDAVLKDIQVGQPVCHHKNYMFAQLNENKHKSQCVFCKEVIETEHSMRGIAANGFGHNMVCTLCGFKGEYEDHKLIVFKGENRCTVCGYKGLVGLKPLTKNVPADIIKINYEADCCG